MISKKRTWQNCADLKIRAIFEEVKEETKRLYPEYFKDCKIEFYIDSSKSHLGQCTQLFDKSTLINCYGYKNHYDKIRATHVVILLSRYVQDESAARSVIIHEFGHMVTPRENHSKSWFARANKIGEKFNVKITTKKANEYEDKHFKEKIKEENPKHGERKYTIRCINCGREAHYKKMCKPIKHPEYYKCGKCGGTLKRIK